MNEDSTSFVAGRCEALDFWRLDGTPADGLSTEGSIPAIVERAALPAGAGDAMGIVG